MLCAALLLTKFRFVETACKGIRSARSNAPEPPKLGTLFVAAHEVKSSKEELPCERDTSDEVTFEDVTLVCMLWLLTEVCLLLLSRIKGTK